MSKTLIRVRARIIICRFLFDACVVRSICNICTNLNEGSWLISLYKPMRRRRSKGYSFVILQIHHRLVAMAPAKKATGSVPMFTALVVVVAMAFASACLAATASMHIYICSLTTWAISSYSLCLFRLGFVLGAVQTGLCRPDPDCETAGCRIKCALPSVQFCRSEGQRMFCCCGDAGNKSRLMVNSSSNNDHEW